MWRRQSEGLLISQIPDPGNIRNAQEKPGTAPRHLLAWGGCQVWCWAGSSRSCCRAVRAQFSRIQCFQSNLVFCWASQQLLWKMSLQEAGIQLPPGPPTLQAGSKAWCALSSIAMWRFSHSWPGDNPCRVFCKMWQVNRSLQDVFHPGERAVGANLLLHMTGSTALLPSAGKWRQVLCQDTSGVSGVAPTTSLLAAGKILPPPRDTSPALCSRWSDCCGLTAVIIVAYRFLTSWTHIQALLRHAGLSWCLLSALTLRGEPHRGGGGEFVEEPHLLLQFFRHSLSSIQPSYTLFCCSCESHSLGEQHIWGIRLEADLMPPRGWLRVWGTRMEDCKILLQLYLAQKVCCTDG